MSDWKPGDVAKVGPSVVTFYQTSSDAPVMWTNAFGYQHEAAHLDPCARRLVVIDPEDREAVERLADAIAKSGVHRGRVAKSAETNALQAALREFANPKPPKPDEPQDLAARVIDNQGDEWARIRRGDKSFWVNGFGGNTYSWAALVEDFGPLEVRP